MFFPQFLECFRVVLREEQAFSFTLLWQEPFTDKSSYLIIPIEAGKHPAVASSPQE